VFAADNYHGCLLRLFIRLMILAFAGLIDASNTQGRDATIVDAASQATTGLCELAR
jgi:hypothetical protein